MKKEEEEEEEKACSVWPRAGWGIFFGLDSLDILKAADER